MNGRVLTELVIGVRCSFGDGEFKPLGVTAEPEIKHRIVEGGSAKDGT